MDGSSHGDSKCMSVVHVHILSALHVYRMHSSLDSYEIMSERKSELAQKVAWTCERSQSDRT